MNKLLICIFSVFIFIGGFALPFANAENIPAKLQNITVALDWYINPDHAPLLVAETHGFFKQEGLNVNFITPTETSDPSRMVLTSQANFAIVYTPQFIAQISSGMPLQYTSTLVNQPLNCIAVLDSSGITKLSELKGKSLGFSSDGTGFIVIDKFLNFNGLKQSDVKLINLQMNLIQPLLTGRVAAVYGMMRNVEPVQMELMGKKVRCFYPEDNGIPQYSELILISSKKCPSNLIDKFNSALKKAVEYLKAHPEKSWEEVSNSKKFHEFLAPTIELSKVNQAVWNATYKYFDNDPGNVNKKEVLMYAEFLSKNGDDDVNIKKLKSAL